MVAKESNPERLAELAARGYDPILIARRIVFFGLWARFEALFFHADPHPGNLFAIEGNEIAIIDFGGCGTTSSQTMRHRLEVVRHLVRADATAISGIMLSDLSPLPKFDSNAFKREMDKPIHDLLMAVEDPSSYWSERMVASVWLRMLEVTRRYQLRVNLDTIRSIRAFLLYDTVAFRLDPTLDDAVLERYLHQVTTRQARRVRARYRRMQTRPGYPLLPISAVLERGEQMTYYATTQIERTYHVFTSGVSRAVSAICSLLQLCLGMAIAGTFLELARLADGAPRLALRVFAMALFFGFATSAVGRFRRALATKLSDSTQVRART